MQAPPRPNFSGPLALRHLDSAYNLARWLTQDDAQAEDVVRRACFEAFESLDASREQGARVGLMAIVRRSCLTRPQRTHEPEPLTGAPTAGRDMRGRINAALRGLPPQLREVIVLREMEELPYRAISFITDVPVDTVMARLACARVQLARRLERSVA
jgi:RNA polymerase sigma-70 factor (ECF subfamily)